MDAALGTALPASNEEEGSSAASTEITPISQGTTELTKGPLTLFRETSTTCSERQSLA